jgi:GTP pyrophosphokinase
MRTGDAWPEQKRRDKARETMEVYAPIANRLGILNIKEELEDRSLHYLDPVGYAEISTLLSERAGEEFLTGVSGMIERRLVESGIEGATMKRRIKSIYGIYRKMYMQNKSFDEIYDVYAVRIILDTLAECYSALGLIHDMYHPLPNRFKDYISTPKPNGYQSLHTTVIGHTGIPFEVQIRTREMDEQAEYGIAAHWKYKEGIEGSDKLDARLAWVRQLLENQRVSEDSGNLLHDLKSDLLPEEVFAFTPKGDVINLPAGATCIDFAYAIHSAVGNRMIGCKVNNRMVPIDHIVATGDIIEVVLGPADKGPSRDWLKIVRTSEAKSKIRNWFKKMRREENIAQGRDALAKELRREGIVFPDDKLDEFVDGCCRRMRQNNAEDLYAAIGYGGLTVAHCLPKLKEEYQKLRAAEEPDAPAELPKMDLSRVHATDGVVVEGFDNTPIKFAKCCSPLPGDPIIGFITRGFGVSIHKQSCVNVAASQRDATNAARWVKAYWADSVKDSYKAALEIVAMDRDDLLRDVLAILSDMRVPIYNMNARQAENNCGVINLTIGINNTEHLNRVVQRLSKVRDVFKVTRN